MRCNKMHGRGKLGYYIISGLLLVVAFSFSCCRVTPPTEKPNIILIYADDLGIGLLGHEGQRFIETPNIDKLAYEGLRFQNAYSCMLCAPARASLLTGRHDCHEENIEITSAGIYKKISTGEYTHQEVESIINEKLSPVPDDVDFLSKVARESGYITAQFGKLEWGFAASHRQLEEHGWEHYFGYLDHIRAHGFYPPFLFRNGKMIEIEGNTHADCGKTGEPETPEVHQGRHNMEGKEVYSQNIFMDSILDFISSNRDNRFLLYFPTQLPHGPVSIPSVHSDFVDHDSLTPIEKEYASMVKMLDDNVGQIVDRLKDLGIDRNTLIIFTADNGHEIYYAQKGRVHKPYENMKTGVLFDNYTSKFYSELGGDIFDGNAGRAGLKRSNLQGGIEVPMIMRWPERVESGQVSNRLVANYDLLPTIAQIVEYDGPISTDGVSFYNRLVGMKSDAAHEHIVFSSFVGPTLISKDGWKLRTYLKEEVFELYYLPDDYREEHDLSKKYPDKVSELKIKLLAACDGDYSNGLYSPLGSQIELEGNR